MSGFLKNENVKSQDDYSPDAAELLEFAANQGLEGSDAATAVEIFQGLADGVFHPSQIDNAEFVEGIFEHDLSRLVREMPEGITGQDIVGALQDIKKSLEPAGEDAEDFVSEQFSDRALDDYNMKRLREYIDFLSTDTSNPASSQQAVILDKYYDMNVKFGFKVANYVRLILVMYGFDLGL